MRATQPQAMLPKAMPRTKTPSPRNLLPGLLCLAILPLTAGCGETNNTTQAAATTTPTTQPATATTTSQSSSTSPAPSAPVVDPV
jgi:hypothetical protein